MKKTTLGTILAVLTALIMSLVGPTVTPVAAAGRYVELTDCSIWSVNGGRSTRTECQGSGYGPRQQAMQTCTFMGIRSTQYGNHALQFGYSTTPQCFGTVSNRTLRTNYG